MGQVHGAPPPGRRVARRITRRVALWIGGAGILIATIAASGYLMGRGPAGPEVLPPAPGPPAVGLCTEPIVIGADHAASPLFCSNGDINRRAWRYFAGAHLSVMGLGIFASDTDVATAIGQDLRGGSTGAMECGAYRLSVAYYGWGFVVDPTQGTLKEGCPLQRP